jgi:hypothetical protein
MKIQKPPMFRWPATRAYPTPSKGPSEGAEWVEGDVEEPHIDGI